MIKHHTKNKGDLGVLKVKLDLFQKDYLILNPEIEHAPFDLVIYKNGQFKTVQVKYRSLNSRGGLEIPFKSSYCNTNGTVCKSVDKTIIDLYAVYCPETDQCYYFNPKLYNKSITLRLNPTINNQKKGIHFTDDFLEVPE